MLCDKVDVEIALCYKFTVYRAPFWRRKFTTIRTSCHKRHLRVNF